MRRAAACLLGTLALLLPTVLVDLPPAAAAKGPEIRGRAVDAGGASVPGATVVVVQPGGGLPGDMVGAVRAGEDGRFVVPAGWRPERYVVGVCLQDPEEHPGCGDDDGLRRLVTYVGTDGPQPSLLHVGGYHRAGATGAVELGDVPLEEAATLRVVTGSSAVRAVTLDSRSGQPDETLGGDLQDGADLRDGVTTFSGIRPGGYRVLVHWPIGDAGGWARDVRVGPGTTTVDLTGPDAVVRGSVQVDGEPVAGLPVSLLRVRGSRSDGGAVRTDAEGRYALEGVQPSDRPWVLRFGGGRMTDGARLTLARRVTVPARSTDLRVDVSLRADGLGAVTGAVREEHARLDLYDAAGTMLGDTWTTGAGHRLRLPPLVPGTYRLHGGWYDSRNGVWDHTWRTFEVRAGRVTRLGPLAPRAAGRAIVVRAPVGSVAQLTGGAPRWARQPYWGRKRVGSSGRVRFPDLVSAPYRVSLLTGRTAHLPPPARTVRVGRRDVTVRMGLGPRPGSLRGLLVDARTNRPWPWRYGFAQVTCRRGGSGPAHTAPVHPRPDGAAFELTRLPAGSYSCRVGDLADPATVLPYHLTTSGRYDVRVGRRTSARVPVAIAGG